MKIKAMIAEDERLAREELAWFIKQEEDFELCPSAENGRQLLELYKIHEPSVVFLDVEMPGLSGMEVAKKLFRLREQGAERLPLVVFTTAYDEYAIEAFGIEAVDYLLKPYDTERFQTAIGRIRKQLAANQSLSAGSHLSSARPSKLLVDDGERSVMLHTQDILFAVRMERFVEIHTATQTLQTKWTLQELDDRLKGSSFFRSHRSYLVNLDFVHEITAWVNGAYTIVLNNPKRTQIPVSRLAAKALFRLLEP